MYSLDSLKEYAQAFIDNDYDGESNVTSWPGIPQDIIKLFQGLYTEGWNNCVQDDGSFCEEIEEIEDA